MINFPILLRAVCDMLENRTGMQNLNLTEDYIALLLNKINASRQIERTICEECAWNVADFATEYSNKYHGYVALIVCLFGTFANILNIAVLTRKDIACAPINRILTGLAVADLVLMLEYMTFAYYYHIVLKGKLDFPFMGAVFVLFHTHFTQIFHTISICLTLALAVWRYLAIGYPEQNRILCSNRRCTWAIFLSYLLPFVICSPTYLVFSIKSTTVMEDKEYILYHTGFSDFALNHDSYLVFNFWMYAVIVKLLPCCILTIISFWLIRTIFKAKKRKQVLMLYYVCPTPAEVNGKKKTKSERRAERTTKMLVAVLFLFLLTEFPQGIFGVMIGLKGKCFFLKCYQRFGEVMDILALTNGAINFILYCCMNRMFRITFGQLFRSNILVKWPLAASSEVHTTFV